MLRPPPRRRPLREHPPGHALGEEEPGPHIHAEGPVPGVGRHLQQVAPPHGAHPGIVHQAFEPAKRVPRGIQQCRMPLQRRDIGLPEREAPAGRLHHRGRFRHPFLGQIDADDIEAARRQRGAGGPPDAAACARDEGRRTRAHASSARAMIMRCTWFVPS